MAPASSVGAASGRESSGRQPHSRDLRKGRVSEANRIYLLTTRTHGRQKIFSTWQDAAPLIQALRHTASNGDASTLAYVVMPDHFHWLVQLHGHTALSALMRSVKTWSARQINVQRQAATLPRLSPVWQSGFHDRAVRAEEDLRRLARYVVANPLRAALCDTLGDYPLWDAIWVGESRPEAAPTRTQTP